MMNYDELLGLAESSLAVTAVVSTVTQYYSDGYRLSRDTGQGGDTNTH